MSKTSGTDLGSREVFCRNLNRYLIISGKSQREVAAAVKISPGTFCDWVKGRAYPRVDKIQALADYFGVQKADLVEDVNFAKETISEEEQKVLDLFYRVPEEKREFVLSMIRAAIYNL